MDTAVRKAFGRQQDGNSSSLGVVGMGRCCLDTLLRDSKLHGVKDKDLTEDDTLRGGLNLVYCDDMLDDLFGCHDEIGLMPFLRLAFLAEYEAEHSRFCLVSPDPLGILLPQFIERYTAKTPSMILAPKESRCLQLKASFCGRHYVCDWSSDGMRCGDPLCHSEFAWVQNQICLLYMSGGSAGINSVQFYPFYT